MQTLKTVTCRRRWKGALVIAALNATIVSADALGANITWGNAAGGNYNVSSNWSGGAVPTSADFAYYTQDATYNVTVGALSPGATYAGTFQEFDRGDVTFDMNGGTFQTAGPFGYGFVQVVPAAGTASVRFLNGTVFGDSLVMIGDSGNGSVTLDGAVMDLRQTPLYTTTPRLNIGAFGGGSGTVSIVNGGRMILDFGFSNPAIVGNGSAGNLIVSGPGSSLTSNAQLAAGSFSNTTGTITISQGASVISNRGDSATGTSASIGLGAANTAVGYATVTDPGSRWEQNGTMTVATGGRGTLNILNGGTVSSAGGIIARNAGSSGTVLLSGAGSSWTCSGALAVGGTVAANGGTALLTVGPGATLSVSGLLRIRQGGTSRYSGGTLSAGSVDVLAGGKLLCDSGGDKTLRTNALAIAGGGTIDLNDNDAHVKGGTGYAAVTTMISDARNGGAWDHSGLGSSAARNDPADATTLGALTGGEYLSIYGAGAEFNGQAVNPSDVLVKYTYYGDADFNGEVNFDDYVRIDNGLNFGLTGWVNGDFDLSGGIDFDDAVLIDLGFNAQNGTLHRAEAYLSGDDRSMHGMDDPALRMLVEHFGRFGSDYGAHFLAAVPEPASMCLPIAAFIGCIARRHLRRSSVAS